MAADYLAEVTSPANVDANGRYPTVVIHYQGNSARRRKNLDEQAVRRLIDHIVRLGFTAVVLDFESPPRSALLTSPSPDWPPGRVVCPKIDHPLWGGTGTGDGATIAALIAQAMLFMGIDSGPGHIAAATDTPSVIVWTGHHPVHYCAPSANTLHLVPDEHRELLRGRAEDGERFFETHYRHRTYRDLQTALPRIAEEMLASTDSKAAENEASLVMDGDYWVRAGHRAADMVIVRDVDWQDAYRIAELRLRPRTVLDIGAHIGCFAARARRRWPAAEVACVEANPANIDALHRNVAAFARVFSTAATYEPGPVQLASTVFPDTENTGGSHVLGDASSAPSSEQPIISVPAMNLEQILAACGWESIDLLKLDCEGCEYSLLEHALVDRIGMIVGEYHDRARFDDLIARRCPDWELRRLTKGEPGLFWLINPAHTIPREA
jgi:FkbM family methyltransferase